LSALPDLSSVVFRPNLGRFREFIDRN
jgi:hypothetical protein